MDAPLRPTSKFDTFEVRNYGGMRARDLVEAAIDQTALENGNIRVGAARRMLGYTQRFINALSAYLSVKRALAVWEKPLMDGYVFHGKARRVGAKGYRRTIWRTPPPTAKDWAAKDTAYGFDVRATSPSHILRRVYRLRARTRAALSGPMDTDVLAAKHRKPLRAERAQVYGPPAPKDYSPADDLLMVWPPVFLTPVLDIPLKAEGSNLETLKPVTPDLIRGPERLKQTAHSLSGPLINLRFSGMTPLANTLASQYLWAKAMYGRQGAENFLAGLSDVQAKCLDAFVREDLRAPP